MAAARRKRAPAKKRSAAKKALKKRQSTPKRQSASRRRTGSGARAAKKRPAGGSSKPRGLPNDKAWRELIETAIERRDSRSEK